MKFKLSTEVLQEMVSRAVKGMGNKKSTPITSLLLLELRNNTFRIVTTDATNFLYVKNNKVAGDDFYVVVNGEQFSKLISRMTCKEIEMEVTNNFLQVEGNGTYQIDIPLDEGEFIKYPDPLADIVLTEETAHDVNLSTVKTVLDSCKSSLAVTMETPCYTGYYTGEEVVTTNDYTMSSFGVNLFGSNVLVSPEYMNLLAVMTEEKFISHIVDDKIVCVSSDCDAYGVLMDGVEDFPVEGIKNYIAQGMESKCTINKSALLSVLDRISLFVSPYDDDAIQLTFTSDGLNVESRQSNGVETLPYTESENFKAFTGMMDIREFTNVVKAYPDGEIKFQYGSDRALKLTAGKLAFVIAWIVEQEEGVE